MKPSQALAIMQKCGLAPGRFLSLKATPKTYKELGLPNCYVLLHLRGPGYVQLTKRRHGTCGLWEVGPAFKAFEVWYQKHKEV